MEVPLKRKMEVLIVDDDEICTFVHRRIVEMSGLFKKIRSALNGHSAMQILQRAAAGKIAVPDLILLDLCMPVMNGITFLKAFQRLDARVRNKTTIVLLTDYISQKDKRLTMSLGVQHFLLKPFNREALYSIFDPPCRDNQGSGNDSYSLLECENKDRDS